MGQNTLVLSHAVIPRFQPHSREPELGTSKHTKVCTVLPMTRKNSASLRSRTNVWRICAVAEEFAFGS
jgi:hypothetical protein